MMFKKFKKIPILQKKFCFSFATNYQVYFLSLWNKLAFFFCYLETTNIFALETKSNKKQKLIKERVEGIAM